MNLELPSVFSQSLFIKLSTNDSEETKTDGKLNPSKKPFPFIKNFQENLASVEKYNPMINKELNLKYFFNKLMMDLEKYMKETDINKSKAPFLPHTFQVWRQEAWEKLQKNLKNLTFVDQQKYRRKFIGKVDGDYLIKFFRSMKEPFFENYHMPSDLKDPNFKKDDFLCNIL